MRYQRYIGDQFSYEISEVLGYAFKTHGFLLVRAWVRCARNLSCLELGHVNSVSILESAFENSTLDGSRVADYHWACSTIHLSKAEGIVGQAFATKQPLFSADVASSSDAEDPLSSCARDYGIHTAAIAIPLQSIVDDDCVLEFLFPFDCTSLQEQKKIVAALFSTLRQRCKTLRVASDEVKSTSPLPIFQALLPSEAVEQSGADDSLFPKENPTEADPNPALISVFIPKYPSRRMTADYLWPDLQNSLRLGTVDVDDSDFITDSCLNDPAKFTGGKSSAGSKRDWAWKYCSSIPGNSNGLICSFCHLEIKGGGITQFKSHISGSDPSKNIKKCEKVPPEAKAEIDHKKTNR